MANINLYGSKLVWPSSAAGEHISGRSYGTKYNMYFLVAYGKKHNTKTDQFYLFTYIKTFWKNAGSPSEPETLLLEKGKPYNNRGLKVTTSNWKTTGNHVSFKLSINFKSKNHSYNVSGDYK